MLPGAGGRKVQDMSYYHPHEIEEAEFGFGPRLWDATPGVCCAAFQLGACEHTEGYDYDDGTDYDWDDEQERILATEVDPGWPPARHYDADAECVAWQRSLAGRTHAALASGDEPPF